MERRLRSSINGDSINGNSINGNSINGNTYNLLFNADTCYGNLIGNQIILNGTNLLFGIEGDAPTYIGEIVDAAGNALNVNGVGYSDSSPAFAGHVRGGKLQRFDKNNLMHIYGVYSHTHVNGMDKTFSTGKRYLIRSTTGRSEKIFRRADCRLESLHVRRRSNPISR
ncbi:MAG: hypothetical protein SR1Q7_02770 [Quinella sp. 1Q7]|nr:hypothetical protein [Quinella sp. 1Q7]